MRFYIAAALIFLMSLSPAYAKPEMMKLKTEKQRKHHDLNRAKAAGLQLSKIKDPEVRKALQIAFDSMGLPVKR